VILPGAAAAANAAALFFVLGTRQQLVLHAGLRKRFRPESARSLVAGDQ